MKQKTLLYLFLILTIFAMPLLLPGSAVAVYNPDGSVATGTAPNGTYSGAGAGWSLVDMGQCVSGISATGVMTVTADTNQGDCIANNVYPLSTYGTSAACTSFTNNEGSSHYWSSACVGSNGQGITLNGLDRNATSCTAKGGTYESVCTASWVWTGSPIGTNNSGTMGAGSAGNANVGFCYAKMTLGSPYSSTNCPTTTALGYAVSGTTCQYSYGVSGTLSSALSYKGGGTSYAAGTSVNLASIAPTQGQCLAIGGSWNTWLAESGTTTLSDGTIIANSYADGDVGCLHCHNSVGPNSTVAGDSGHWKESYLKTGHKNMLRAVTPGQAWYGPDGVEYGTGGADCTANPSSSDCGTVAFNWGSATVGSKTLLYIFGDWIGAEPVTPYYLLSNSGPDGASGISGSETAYTCGNCHSTGFNNIAPNTDGLGAGACNDSTKTTASTCTGTFTPGSQSGAFNGSVTRTWYPMTGIQEAQSTGVLGGTLEPQNTFPGINLGTTSAYNPQWDFNGIICSRCHESIISANKYTFDPSGEQSSSTMGTLPSTMAGRVNLCVGCHTSLATDYSAVSTGQKTYDPTVIPTSAASATAYAGWSGSGVDGNEYLNSPHARYSGLEQPNALGEHDLAGNGTAFTGTFSTAFTGPLCNGGNTAFYWNGSAAAPITNASECQTATGSSTKWANDTAPGCTSCHDVHQSVSAGVNATKPFHNECLDCHNDGTQLASHSNHPAGPGTPFGIANGLGAGGGTIGTQFSANNTDGSTACVICHMPEINAGAVETHVFRINPSANYSTFPTPAQLYGGSCSTNVSAATSSNCAGTYHGTWELYNGGTCVITSSANCSSAGGVWTAQTKDTRALTSPETYVVSGATPTLATYNNAVWVDVDLACGQCHGGSQGPSAVNNGAPYKSKLELAGDAANMHNTIPTVQFTSQAANNGAVQFNASATICPSGSCSSYSWNFGDNSTTGAGVAPSHTYSTAGNYTVTLTAIDNGNFPSSNTWKLPQTFNTGTNTVAVNIMPTVSETVSASGMTATLIDSSTPAGSPLSINWGDGSAATTGNSGGTFTHTYTVANTYSIVATLTVNGVSATEKPLHVSVPTKYTVSGTVIDQAGDPLQGVSLALKLNGVTKAMATTDVSGNYTFINVVPGTYTVNAVMTGYTFASPALSGIVVSGNVTGENISSSN